MRELGKKGEFTDKRLLCPQLSEKVDALISQHSKGLPLSFGIHHPKESKELVGLLKERGFQLLITCPLMTWSVEEVTLPSCEIRAADLEIFNAIIATTFGFDEKVAAGYYELLSIILHDR